MQTLYSRSPFIFALLAVFVSVFLYLSLGERPNLAQTRPTPPALKARFSEFANADAVTNDIRDRSKEIVRVQLNSIGDREKVAKLGRIVQDFGSSVILSKNKS